MIYHRFYLVPQTLKPLLIYLCVCSEAHSTFRLCRFYFLLVPYVVLVSAVQQSEAVICMCVCVCVCVCVCIYISPLYSRLHSHTGHYITPNRVPVLYSRSLLLTILYIVVCLCQSQSPSLSHHFLLGKHMFVFYICDSISVLDIGSFVPFVFRVHI